MRFIFDDFEVEVGFDEIFNEHPQDINDFLKVLINLGKPKDVKYFDFEILFQPPLDYFGNDLIIEKKYFDDGISGNYSQNIEEQLKNIIEDFLRDERKDE